MLDAFQILADPTRRRIVEALREGERTVSAIVEVAGISQSGVSRHLRILQEAGFVVARPDSQERYYSLRAQRFGELDAWLKEFRGPGRSEVEGKLLHAKHALQPNSLGYCGPDENSTILEHLHESTVSDRLTSTLTKFEAAYPFVRLIAKSTGRSPFDRDVTEAYWIGNSLLDMVEPAEFYRFVRLSLGDSRKKMAGKTDGPGAEETRSLFRELGPMAKPHHTFYVLGMYARSNTRSGNEGKLLDLMDSCRISWGRVAEVKKSTLVVERPGLALADGRLSLASAESKEVSYDPLIPSFSGVRTGDWVTVHWNYASERLVPDQLSNLSKYTLLDIEAANRVAGSTRGEGRER